jgi:hypothetical protein
MLTDFIQGRTAIASLVRFAARGRGCRMWPSCSMFLEWPPGHSILSHAQTRGKWNGRPVLCDFVVSPHLDDIAHSNRAHWADARSLRHSLMPDRSASPFSKVIPSLDSLNARRDRHSSVNPSMEMESAYKYNVQTYRTNPTFKNKAQIYRMTIAYK